MIFLDERKMLTISYTICITFVYFISRCYYFASGNYLISNEEQLLPKNSHNHENTDHYTNKWIVKVANSTEAILLAEVKGFHYKGRITGFEEYHLLEKLDHPIEHREKDHHHTQSLDEHEHVIWTQQISNRRLSRRDFVDDEDELEDRITDSYQSQVKLKLTYKKQFPDTRKNLFEESMQNDQPDDEANVRKLYKRAFNDELWSLQWYEVGLESNSTSILDMNLLPVYKLYNITGDGVNVMIIDDGIEHTHEDLTNNFDPSISFNLNFNITDVTPRYEDPRNKHGTRCAGVVAMQANNKKCGVGIAYNAKVGGITLLDGATNDILEAIAVTHAIEKVHIYSGSWGPQDNGYSVDGPGRLTAAALLRGITQGRNGLGALYVFAAGNGGVRGDHCGADGYVNSVYSIAITSATQNGDVPYYAERCPAIMATTYSGSAKDTINIITTDVKNSCTWNHSGTSASAPLAAGILAVVLQANPTLTWRDVFHLIVWTSEIAPLKTKADWSQNAFGLWFTPQFGFGLLNAFKLVKEALEWKTVPGKFICCVPFNLDDKKTKLSPNSAFMDNVESDGCDNTVQYLEHVQLIATVEYTARGHIEIELISPSGTRSKLMEVRPKDTSNRGYVEWPFLSLQFWGESPKGNWTVTITDQVKKKNHVGRVKKLELILHGTEAIPSHYLRRQREYEPFN